MRWQKKTYRDDHIHHSGRVHKQAYVASPAGCSIPLGCGLAARPPAHPKMTTQNYVRNRTPYSRTNTGRATSGAIPRIPARGACLLRMLVTEFPKRSSIASVLEDCA